MDQANDILKPLPEMHDRIVGKGPLGSHGPKRGHHNGVLGAESGAKGMHGFVD